MVVCIVFFFLMIRRPPRSTLFPTRRSSDLFGQPDAAFPVRPDARERAEERRLAHPRRDRKSTRLNSSHGYISYAVFCLKKKTAPPAIEASCVVIKPLDVTAPKPHPPPSPLS